MKKPDGEPPKKPAADKATEEPADEIGRGGFNIQRAGQTVNRDGYQTQGQDDSDRCGKAFSFLKAAEARQQRHKEHPAAGTEQSVGESRRGSRNTGAIYLFFHPHPSGFSFSRRVIFM